MIGSELVTKAGQLYRQGDVLNAAGAVGLAALSFLPGEAFAWGGVRSGVGFVGGRLGLFGGKVSGAESVAKTVRYTELASNASKADVRALLRSGELDLPAEQIDKLLYTLGNGRMDGITLNLMENGDVRLAAVRSGRTSGYQRMSFEIDQYGKTNKVVQTAFDDANKLVPQRPGESRNNLYDVKKWTR